jgi:SAM-dependent methyltransferase
VEWYEDDGFWVDFAEVLFSEDRAKEAVDRVAISPLLKVTAGTTVLDLACGPGTYTAPMARQGAEVTGVDLSEAMLARARRACAEAGVRALLVRADMRDFVEPESFDLVISMYTSFGYFSAEENLRVLRNARASLAQGGRMVMDLMGKEVYAKWAGTPKAIDVEGGTLFMRDTILDGWSRFRSDWTLIRGDTVRRGHFEQFVYSGAEIRALVEAAGFDDVEIFGDFDRSPYDQNARRLVVQAFA